MPRGRFKRLLLSLISALCLLPAALRAEDQGPMKLVQRPEEQALVVSLRLNSVTIGDNLIVYQDGKRLLVPLGGVLRALELAITADPESGKASGFFINEDRRFELDLATATVRFDGRSFALAPGSAERQLIDIYVDSTLLAEWFSIRLHFSEEDLALIVSSLELLPVQERLERERRRNGVPHDGAANAGYTLKEPPMRWIDWPFVDTNIEFSTNRSDGHQSQQAQYTSIVTDQVAGLDLDMAVNGAAPNLQQATTLRATLGRRDPSGGLLGPIDAREFFVGDVSLPNLPLTANSVAGRGAMVSTFDLHRLSDLQRITLRGELPVGWEVELYRGGDLIDFETSSTNGRYEFDNVPTIPGLNAFKLVFYGPEGQRREEDQPIYVTAASVAAGETGFRLAVNQQNVDLFGTQTNQPQPTTLFDRFDQIARDQLFSEPNVNNGATRLIAEVEHGLTDTMSLNGAVSNIPFGGTNYQYLQAGLRASLLGALTHIETAGSSNGGIAFGAGAQGQINTWSWLLSHNQFEGNFVSELSFDTALNLPLASLSTAQLNGILPDFGVGRMPFAASATYGPARGGGSHTELSERLSSYFGRFTVGAETRADLIAMPPGQAAAQPGQTTEILRLGTSFGPVNLHGEALYEVAPTAAFDAAQLTADFRLKPDLNLRLGAVHFDNPSESQLVAGAAKLYDKFALGADANVSNHGDFSMILKLSFSFGVEPRSGLPVFHGESFARSGAISPRVFIDRNGDGVFGPGDVPLENVRFRSDGQPFRGNATDDSGTTLITNLEPYRQTPVSIDLESLEDPFWKPSEQKIAVLPRPGSVVNVDFPVYETGEVSGSVEIAREGHKAPLPGIRMEVIDAKGKIVAQTLSGYDGSFFIESVRLGSYKLRVDPDQIDRLHLAPVEPQQIELTRAKPTVAAAPITLTSAHAATEEATAPSSEPPPPATPATAVKRIELPAARADRPPPPLKAAAPLDEDEVIQGLRAPHAAFLGDAEAR